MLINMLKSKIHRAAVTEANLHYRGSITICEKLMKKANILTNEKVYVVNINNGKRFATYAIPGKDGEICLNGAAARLAHVGDLLIVMAFCLMDQEEAKNHKPKIVFMEDGE